MMRFLLPIMVLLGCLSCSATAQTTGEQRAAFNQVFEGTIGGRPVSLVFPQVLNDTSGRYHYQNGTGGGELHFVARRSRDNHLIFSEITTDSPALADRPVWDCRYADGKLTGYRYPATNGEKLKIGLVKKDTTSFLFRIVRRDSLIDLWPGDSATPQYDWHISFPLALGTRGTVDWLNYQISDFLSPDTSGTLSQRMNRQLSTAIRNYRETYPRPRPQRARAALNWVSTTQGRILFNHNGYVIIADEGYQFSGGAHGSSWAVFAVLDARSRKKVALPDLLSADSTVLQSMLEHQFRIAYELAPDDSLTDYLFENKLMPNQNFYFSQEGLTFVYNQYEVAPYVMGIISLTLPWDALREYLQPGFKQRMDL